MSYFVAVDLDDAVRADIARLVERCAREVEAKWLPPQKLHLTVQYLAHPTPERLAELEPKLAAIARGRAPFSLSLEGAGLFETRRAPQVLWLGVAGELPALAALQHEVAEACGIKQEHPFVPHLTLARAHPPRSLAAVARSLESYSSPPFGVSGLTLYESRDHVYRVVTHVKFC